MTVTAPPRPPHPSDPVDREELEALVEALIEEARQRARRRRRIYAATVSLVALAGIAVFMAFERAAQSQTAAPALAARSSVPAATPTSRIAFISTPSLFGRQVPGGLYVVNADGSGKRELTRARYATPAWSPDGRTLAFVRSGQVYVMNTDGSGEQSLTNSPGGAAAPAWSPDGRRIAFMRLGMGGHVNSLGYLWDIYVMNADGSGQRRLARDTWRLAAPVWSPDGQRLAFVARRAGKDELHVVSADGSGERRLTTASRATPAWSPDGRKIAFVRSFDVHVLNVDGTGQRNLTRSPEREFGPLWSPDGRRIVFERKLGQRHFNPCGRCIRASIFEVHVVNADGNGQQRLVRFRERPRRSRSEWPGADPRWSPDGRKIAFRNSQNANWEIYVMNADGSGQRNLSRSPTEDDCCFAWSPAKKP